jgi:hypothetical protein
MRRLTEADRLARFMRLAWPAQFRRAVGEALAEMS